jgi:hypothetical protein
MAVVTFTVGRTQTRQSQLSYSLTTRHELTVKWQRHSRNGWRKTGFDYGHVAEPGQSSERSPRVTSAATNPQTHRQPPRHTAIVAHFGALTWSCSSTCLRVDLVEPLVDRFID